MNGFKGTGNARPRAGRMTKLVPALIAAFMIVAGVAIAAGGGLSNGSFEQGSGNSLDAWQLKAYHYDEESDTRSQVYGPGSGEPVPCAEGEPYGICVVEGDDEFETYDFETEATSRHRVPVLDGEKMVRLGGPYGHMGFRQATDGLAIEQSFTVDAANPIVNLNYYLSSFDYPGYDEADLRVKLVTPGEPTVVWRLDAGSGFTSSYKSTGWQSSDFDLTDYAGQVVKLEIELRTDESYPSWAYIDAGTAPASPIDAADIVASVPSTDPGGEPVSLKRVLNGPGTKVYYLLRADQAERFDGGCLPVSLDIPVNPGVGSLSDLTVSNGEGSTAAEEVEPNLWRAEVFCPSSAYLTFGYEIDGAGGDREKQAINLGGIVVSEPRGIVYDTDIYRAELASGKSAEDAKNTAKVAGASVTIQFDGPAGFTDVAEDDPRTLPSTPTQLSGTDGSFQWLLGSGEYRVRVSKTGYEPAVSEMFDRNNAGGIDVGLTKVKGPIVDPPIVDPPDVPRQPVDPVPACSNLKGAGKIHCQRLEDCKKLSGKKRSNCQKLAQRRKKCISLNGRKKSACEKKAKALTRCDKLKGKKKRKCVARANRAK